MKLLIPWFLWSIVHPGGQYSEKEIHATVVKEFKSKEACEAARPKYQVEVNKAYPPQTREGWVTQTTFSIVCSPVNPKP